jgi:hypothetical protein
MIGSALPEAERRRQVLDEAFQTTRAIGDGKARSQILARLAIALAGEGEAARARTVAESIADEDDGERMRALLGVVPALPEGERRAVLEEALLAAGSIDDKVARCQALAEVAAAWTGAGATERGLQVARGIESETVRVCAFIRVIPALPEGERPAVLEEALRFARAIEDNGSRSEALALVASALPEAERQREVLDEALQTAEGVEVEEMRALALAQVAFRLPEDRREELLTRVLQLAQDHKLEALRSVLLSFRSMTLDGERHRQYVLEALQATREVKQEAGREESLTWLVPELLRAELLPEALHAARSIRGAASRAIALATVAGDLTGHDQRTSLHEAAKAALSSPKGRVALGEDRATRPMALAAVATGLRKLPTQEVSSWWTETLPQLAAQVRADFVHDLGALVPVIAALGGPEALAQSARAVEDVGRWWPDTIDLLPLDGT